MPSRPGPRCFEKPLEGWEESYGTQRNRSSLWVCVLVPLNPLNFIRFLLWPAKILSKPEESPPLLLASAVRALASLQPDQFFVPQPNSEHLLTCDYLNPASGTPLRDAIGRLWIDIWRLWFNWQFTWFKSLQMTSPKLTKNYKPKGVCGIQLRFASHLQPLQSLA